MQKLIVSALAAVMALSASAAKKSAPAFDALGVAGNDTSGENDEFGDVNNTPANFTDYSASKNGKTVSAKVKEAEYLLNPMEQIGQQGVTVAPALVYPSWFHRPRHGLPRGPQPRNEVGKRRQGCQLPLGMEPPSQW